MDDTIKHGYEHFLAEPAGQDLLKRLVTTEAKYQMEGMKATTLEEKGIAMSKIEATYAIRTMLQDLATPKPASKPAKG
jgi:hypothetical protein